MYSLDKADTDTSLPVKHKAVLTAGKLLSHHLCENKLLEKNSSSMIKNTVPVHMDVVKLQLQTLS